MADFKLAGIVSAVGFGLGYLLSGSTSQVMEAEGKPKLTPKQLEYLNEMKTNYDGYAYVEVDNRGWKPYKTGPVQQLLDKKIISIPKDQNKGFYGRVKNFEAYYVIINPIALKYPYTEPKGYEHYGGALRGTDKFAEYMAKQQPQQSSQNASSVQGEYGITYMESHNDAKNQHKYYLLLTSGKDNYTAYGRLPGYGREATMKLDKQPSASKMKELAMNKMKTYQLVGHKYDQIPSEIRAKLETEIGVKPSSPPAESQPKQEEPKKPMNPYLAMAMKRRQMMGAEYQPDQEIGDYSVSEIAKSSAIEGYQPNKYSFGPIGYGAEMKLKKDSCCCGATKKHPCLCMIKGTKQCSAKSPMCPCYKEIAMGTKVEMEHTTSKEEAEKIAKEHLAEHPDYYSRLKKAGLSAETIIPRDFVCSVCDSSNLKIDVERNEVFCDDCGLVNEDLMQTVKRKPIQLSDRSKYGCWGFRVPIMDDPDFVKIDWEMKAESSDSIPKANPADKEETFAWVKREHPHNKTEADKEMDEYNYAALTYHPEELESGAVNALKAGDLEAAQNFVKALNRQNFIKAFQAERNR